MKLATPSKKALSAMRRRAALWRAVSQHQAGHGVFTSYVGIGGYVKFHRSRIVGWCRDIPFASEYEPGVILVAELNGPIFLSMGGNEWSGAEKWETLHAGDHPPYLMGGTQREGVVA